MNSSPLPFVGEHLAPDKRGRFVTDGLERKLCEGAVQVATGLWLLNQPGSDGAVSIFPDGEHGKRYDIRTALESRGFELNTRLGSTSYGGVYNSDGETFTVNPKSMHGRGDVIGIVNGRTVRVECKGGVINSRHSGVASRLRSGLAELIGQAMAMEDNGDRHLVVLPLTSYTRTLAERLAPRCSKAGVEIALVQEDGQVMVVK